MLPRPSLFPSSAPGSRRPVETRAAGPGNAPSAAWGGSRAILLLAVLAGCADPEREAARGAAQRRASLPPGGIVSAPLQAPGSRTGRFERLPASAGLVFANEYDWEHPRRHLYEHGFAGGGVALGDLDGNGLPDVYLVSQTGRDALFLQTAPLRFEDATARAGVDEESAWGSGVTLVDVDADGDLDVYLCNYDAPNRLYENRGDATFEEVSEQAGVAFVGASIQASFADFDRDGDLDFYLTTNRLYPGPGLDVPRTHQVDGRVTIVPGGEESFEILEVVVDGETQKYVGKSGQPDRLFRNDGSGRFEDVTRAAGVFDRAPGLSATWTDLEGDGWPDLYVGNDYFAPDRLWRNQGDGTFRDVLSERVPHTPWFTMGTASADLDNDGRLDIVATDMAATTHYGSKIMMGDMDESRWFLESAEPRQYMRNAVFRNTGTERFLEVAFLANLASTDWTWSVKLADLDNDGRTDAYFTNGTANNTFDPDLTRAVGELGQRMRREGRPADQIRAAQWELYRSKEPRRERNLAFQNRGELRFEDVGDTWGLSEEVVSYGAAVADLDRDGDLDLVVNHLGAPAAVHVNGLGGNGFLVRLEGRESPSHGTGATLIARTDEAQLLRYAVQETGYLSSDEPLLHFGLGEATEASLEVRWPSGHVQRFESVAAGHLHTVVEPEGTPPAATPKAPRRTLFAENRTRLPHVVPPQRPFDDYAQQPLLPYRLSVQGPGVAWGDLDGDGREDLVVGASEGHRGALLRGTGGTFESAAAGSAASEDAMILLLDPDADGDLDAFFAAAGARDAGGRRSLLATNQDGTLGTPQAIPGAPENCASACAADLDGDGDLEVFVGGRSVAGSYPRTPASALLASRDGDWVDVTEALAP